MNRPEIHVLIAADTIANNHNNTNLTPTLNNLTIILIRLETPDNQSIFEDAISNTLLVMKNASK